MKRSVTIAMVGVCLLAASCRQQHIKTVHIRVPDMHNDACVAVVSNGLRGVRGLLNDRIEFDVPGRTVSVPYDSLELARKNIEFAIVKSGFATEEVVTGIGGTVTNRIPADPGAVKRLPPECLVQP